MLNGWTLPSLVTLQYCHVRLDLQYKLSIITRNKVLARSVLVQFSAKL
jgi:hypothetical protein